MLKVKVDFSGFDKVRKKLDDLRSMEVSFGELFNPTFMQQNTQFASLEDFFKAGGFEVNSKEDFEAIPDEVFDEHVAKATKFDSWESMYKQAGLEHMAKEVKRRLR